MYNCFYQIAILTLSSVVVSATNCHQYDPGVQVNITIGERPKVEAKSLCNSTDARTITETENFNSSVCICMTADNGDIQYYGKYDLDTSHGTQAYDKTLDLLQTNIAFAPTITDQNFVGANLIMPFVQIFATSIYVSPSEQSTHVINPTLKFTLSAQSPMYPAWQIGNEQLEQEVSGVLTYTNNILTISFDESLQFKLHFDHPRPEYYNSTCHQNMCVGGIKIEGLGTTVHKAGVKPGGWATSGNYQCPKIGATSYTGKSDIVFKDSAKSASDFFDKTGEFDYVDCLLTDDLVFAPLRVVVPGELSSVVCGTRQPLHEVSTDDVAGWIQSSLTACMLAPPEEPTGTYPLFELHIVFSTDSNGFVSTKYFYDTSSWSFEISVSDSSSSILLTNVTEYTGFQPSVIHAECDPIVSTVTIGKSVYTDNTYVQNIGDVNLCRFMTGLALTDANIDTSTEELTNVKYGSGTCDDIILDVYQRIKVEPSYVLSGDQTFVEGQSIFTEQTASARYTFVHTIDTSPAVFQFESLTIPASTDPITVSVTYNSKTNDENFLPQTTPSSTVCDIQQIDYAATVDLPCSTSSQLTQTVTVYNLHTSADVKPVVTSSGMVIGENVFQSLSVLETKEFPEAIVISSNAIDIDKDNGNVHVDIEYVESDTRYTLGTCTLSLDTKIKCDLIVTKLSDRADIGDGVNVKDEITVKINYKYAPTFEDCGTDLQMQNTDPGTVYMEFEAVNNKFGGKIQITDTTNAGVNGVDMTHSTALESVSFVQDLTGSKGLSYTVPLSEINKSPELEIKVTSLVALKIGWDVSMTCDTVEEWCETGSTDSGYLTPDGTGHVTIKLTPANPYENSNNVGPGIAFETFVFSIQDIDTNPSRIVELSVKSTPDKSVPAVFNQVGANETVMFVDRVLTLTGKEMYTSFKSVSFPIKSIVDPELGGAMGGLDPAGVQIEFVSSDSYGSCKSIGVEPDNTLSSVNGDGTVFSFVTTPFCRKFGIIAFNYDSLCYQIRFECKRHGTVEKTNLDIDLNYGFEYTVASGLSVSEMGGAMFLGGTCEANGQVTGTSLCTKDLKDTAVVIGPGLTASVQEFDKCGTRRSQDTTVPDSGIISWTMDAVREFVINSKSFCQTNEISLEVLTKGTASATIAVQNEGEIKFMFSTNQLKYQTCVDSLGVDGQQILLEIIGTAVDSVGASSTFSTGDHLQSFSVDGGDSSDIGKTSVGSTITMLSPCQSVCTSAVRKIDFEFVASAANQGQDFFAEVSGSASISGNPCEQTVRDTTLSATLLVAVPSARACTTSLPYGSNVEATLSDIICLQLEQSSPDYAFSTKMAEATFETKTSTGSTWKDISSNMTLKSGPLSTDELFTYFKIDDLSFSSEQLRISIPWEYVFETTRRLRTVQYVLGAGSQEGASPVTITILSDTVQVEEDLVADQVDQEDNVEQTSKTSEANTSEGLPEWLIVFLVILGSIVGIVLCSYLSVKLYRAMKRNGYGSADLVDKRDAYKYQRFASNIEF